jgi:hypothetical protein
MPTNSLQHTQKPLLIQGLTRKQSGKEKQNEVLLKAG